MDICVPSVCTCDINGVVSVYDGCTSARDYTLQQAKDYYTPEKGWEYMGIGFIHSVDNQRQFFPYSITSSKKLNKLFTIKQTLK